MPTENRSSNTEMVSVPRELLLKWQSTALEWKVDSIGVEIMHVLAAPAEQHQGERVAAWRDMAAAPRNGTIVRLLVRFSENATEDEGYGVGSPTIGSNSFDDTGEDLWQFAGWSWEQDCYTQGEGAPIGWLPMLGEMAVDAGEVERLRLEIEQLRFRLEAHDHESVQDDCARAENRTLSDEVERLREQVKHANQDKTAAVMMQRMAEQKLAERDALLRNIRENNNTLPFLAPSHRDRIDAALSASAEPISPVAKYPNRLCHIDYQAHPYLCGCLRGDEEAQRIYDDHIRSAKS